MHTEENAVDMRHLQKHPFLPESIWLGAFQVLVKGASLEELAALDRMYTGEETEEGMVQGLYLPQVPIILVWDEANEHTSIELFLHELSHHVFVSAGLDHSEGHVQAMSRTLLTLLVENPVVVSCLFEFSENQRLRKYNSLNLLPHKGPS